MRSATGSDTGVEDGDSVLDSGVDGAWVCGLGGVGCGSLGWVCRGCGTGALAVNAGAVLGGNRGTGFWAVWQEGADIAITASIAIRLWRFATPPFPRGHGILPWI